MGGGRKRRRRGDAVTSNYQQPQKQPCLSGRRNKGGGETERPQDSFSRLPDSILGRILGEIPLVQRIAVEAVCRRWRRVAWDFSWSSTHSLNFEAFHTPMTSAELPIRLSNRRLDCILHRCGRYLRRIDLEAFRDTLDYSVCKTLTDHVTPSLTSLALRGIRLTVRSIRVLEPFAGQFTELDFTMTFESPIVETKLAELIAKCARLESLKVGDNDGLTGEHLFSALPRSLKKLSLRDGTLVEPRFLNDVRLRCPELRELSMSWIEGFHADVDFISLNDWMSLEVLDFSHINYLSHIGASGIALSTLINLKRLSLTYNKFTRPEVLKKLFTNCRQITHLRLAGIRFEDDPGEEALEEAREAVTALGRLPVLEALHISDLHDFNDDVLCSMARHGTLQTLTLVDCKYIGNRGVMAVLENCKDLVSLLVICCATEEETLTPWIESNFANSRVSGDVRPRPIVAINRRLTTINHNALRGLDFNSD